MAKNVVGLFTNVSDAQAAVDDLTQAGFSTSNVALLQRVSSQLSDIFGQLGIPEDDAALYREGVQNGGALVVVQQVGDADAERAVDILNAHGLVDLDAQSRATHQTTGSVSDVVQSTSASSGRVSSRGQYTGGELVIPILEEEIRVGKREVEGGGVRVETTVEERPVSEQVTLRQEEVHVERRAVNQAIDPSQFDALAQEGTFELREHAEEAVVSKQARVVEEVVINKQAQERVETIQDSVRRTDVTLEEIVPQTSASSVTTVTQTSASDVVGKAGKKGKGKSKKRGKR